MPQLIHIAGVGVGVVVAIAGFILLGEGRSLAEDRSDGREAPSRVPWVSGKSPSVRTMLALALLVIGYHVAAYSLPDSIQLLRVPPEHLWLLALGIGVSVEVLGWSDGGSGDGGSGPTKPTRKDEGPLPQDLDDLDSDD